MHSIVGGGRRSSITRKQDNNMSSKSRKKRDQGLGGMVSAMIPGAKVDNKGRVMMNVATTKETIVFNIGGALFETYKSTLFRLPNCPLLNDKFLLDHYRPERKDYFFDRDPDIFRATLNYLRTGELHIPSYICGPAAKTELEFWGVVPSNIERCCWTNYNDWNSTLHALNQLDHDRKGVTMSCTPPEDEEQTWWNVNRPKVWNFMNNPRSSVAANVFGYISLFVVLMSIFSFVADTTSGFAVYKYIPDPSAVTTAANNQTENLSTTSDYVTSASGDNITVTTVPAGGQTFRVKHSSLVTIDTICVVFFTIEYILHLIFAPNKLKYSTSIMGVIDMIAILPDYLEFIMFTIRPDLVYDVDARNVIAILHLSRVLRIFRLIRHVPGLWIFIYTFKSSLGELVLLCCFMLLGILLFSSLIYYAEDRENIESIPHAFWWAIITMTTVGYGDMYPETIIGKLIGSLCAMSGLLMIGFSVPSLVNNFMLFYKHVQYALQAEREAEKNKYSNPPSRSGSAGSRYDALHNGLRERTKDSNGNESTEMKPLTTYSDDKE